MIVKKNLSRLLVLVLLLLTGTLSAQPQNSLLWKISGHGLKKPSYVYGTVHSGEAQAFTFKKLILPYLKECSMFAAELKLDEINPFTMLGKLQMPGDTTLKMLLTEKEYAKLDQVMRDSFGIELAMFATVKPIFLAGILEGGGSLGDLGGGDEDGAAFLDMYLMEQAEKWKKECIGIETVDEQLGAVDMIPLKEQAKMLTEGLLDTAASTGEQLDDLLTIYATGNLDSLYAYYKKGDLSNTFNKAVVLDRNHRMAHRIDSIMQLKTIFVAVGALHLPGTEGVLALLKQQGYTVEPVYDKKTKPVKTTKI